MPKDPQAGAGWLLRAAALGSAPSAFNVGVMYERGFVVERDSSKAAEWYRKAADAGLPTAKHNLALLLRDGKGVARDVKAAIQLLLSAAHQGMAASMFILGDIYEQGDGGTKDPAAALAWFAITGEFERQTNRDGEIGAGEDRRPARAGPEADADDGRAGARAGTGPGRIQADRRAGHAAGRPGRSQPAAVRTRVTHARVANSHAVQVRADQACIDRRRDARLAQEHGRPDSRHPAGAARPETAARQARRQSGTTDTRGHPRFPEEHRHAADRRAVARPLCGTRLGAPRRRERLAAADAAPAAGRRPRLRSTESRTGQTRTVHRPRRRTAPPQRIDDSKIDLGRVALPPPPPTSADVAAVARPAPVPRQPDPPKPPPVVVDTTKPEPAKVETMRPTLSPAYIPPPSAPPPPTSADIAAAGPPEARAAQSGDRQGGPERLAHEPPRPGQGDPDAAARPALLHQGDRRPGERRHAGRDTRVPAHGRAQGDRRGQQGAVRTR